MGKPRKIDRRVLARLDAATIARTTSEEYSQAAAMADACAESAKSNPSRNAFEALAALARREAGKPKPLSAEEVELFGNGDGTSLVAPTQNNGTEPA